MPQNPILQTVIVFSGEGQKTWGAAISHSRCFSSNSDKMHYIPIRHYAGKCSASIVLFVICFMHRNAPKGIHWWQWTIKMPLQIIKMSQEMWLRYRPHQLWLVHLIIMDPKPAYFFVMSCQSTIMVSWFKRAPYTAHTVASIVACSRTHSPLPHYINIRALTFKTEQWSKDKQVPRCQTKNRFSRVFKLFISSYTCLIQVIRWCHPLKSLWLTTDYTFMCLL